MSRRFIAVCKEAGSILGEEQIWEEAVEEKLEDIIKNFLETGKLEYTTIPFDRKAKPKKVSKQIYPDINKLYLWQAVGRFRKRPRKLGNIIEGKL